MIRRLLIACVCVASGCTATTFENVNPEGGLTRFGESTWGSDSKLRVLIRPDGTVEVGREQTGQAHSFERFSNDVTSTVAVGAIVFGMPAIINAFMDGITAINAASKAAAVEKAAIGAGKVAPK